MEKQTKRAAYEGMQRAKELKRQREEIAKASAALEKDKAELEAWRKEREDRRRNPAKYLAAEYGPDWYDKLSSVKLTGSPPADLIASEVDEKVSGSEKKLLERIEQLENQVKERDTQAATREREAHAFQAREYLRENADKYPLIHAFEVQDNIAAVIEHHFLATSKEDDDGNMLPGEVWTFEQAAAEMEKALDAKFSAAEKRRAELKAKTSPTPEAPPQRPQSPQRRSLSTDLTGTSRPERPGPISESDRLKRTLAAIDAQGALRH